jgi:rubrerythrin
MNLFNIIQTLGEVSTSNLLNMSGVDPINKGNRSPNNVLISTAGDRSAITDVLNFALKLEYLESAYYNQGVASGVIPSADLSIFQQIKKHENSHVSFLQTTITALGGTPITSPTFDFTAGGLFNPFYVYADFLALSQAFEDTGVRAYKGQAGNLISNNDVLTAALQIHSVEARHASEVRRLRNKNGMDTSAKGWITGNSRGTLPAATQGIYNGEENTMQGGVDVTTVTPVGTVAVQEAFDEPLTDTMVLSIVQPFIV